MQPTLLRRAADRHVMRRELKSLILILAVLVISGCHPNDGSPARGHGQGTSIRITCFPEGGLRHEYHGSIMGPDGHLADGDEYVPYILLSDGKRQFEILNDIYGLYVQKFGLDPEKEYTFVIERRADGDGYKIVRILDGTELKCDQAVSKGDQNR